MGEVMKCVQQGCDKPATFRYTWPGHGEAGGCDGHAEHAKKVAEAMGFALELIALPVQNEGSTRADELAAALKQNAQALTPESAVRHGQAAHILRNAAKHALVHVGHKNPTDEMACDLMMGHALSYYVTSGVPLSETLALVEANYATAGVQIAESERAIHQAMHMGTKPE